MRYNPAEIEPKWQRIWQDRGGGMEMDAEVALSRRLGLALTASYQRGEARTFLGLDASGEPILTGERRGGTWLFGLGANVHLTPDRRFDLYLGPFLGLLDVDDLPALTAETGLALGATLGVDIPLGSGRWGVTGILRYLDAEIDLEGEADGPPVAGSLDLERWYLGAGLLYRF